MRGRRPFTTDRKAAPGGHSFYVGGGVVSDATYRISAGGELDLATRPELTAELERAAASGRATLHLDLTDVTFIDSTAIKAIATAAAALRSRGGRVEVTTSSRNVLRVFEITGLERLLDLTLTSSSGVKVGEPVR